MKREHIPFYEYKEHHHLSIRYHVSGVFLVGSKFFLLASKKKIKKTNAVFWAKIAPYKTSPKIGKNWNFEHLRCGVFHADFLGVVDLRNFLLQVQGFRMHLVSL